MTNLSRVLAAATLAATLTTGCETMKTQPDSGNNAPTRTAGVKAVNRTGGLVDTAKNSTMGADGAYIEINIYGAEKAATPTAPKAAATETRQSARKAGGAGTKGGSPAVAAPAAAQPSFKIVSTLAPTKNTFELSAPNCGVKSTGAFSSIVEFGKGVVSTVGSAAEKGLAAAGGRAGSSVAGGTFANVGRKAGQDAATTATRAANKTATPAANGAENIATEASLKCDADIKIAAGQLTEETKTLVKNWKSTHQSAVTPVVTFNSSLSAKHEEVLKKAVEAASVPIVTLAP